MRGKPVSLFSLFKKNATQAPLLERDGEASRLVSNTEAQRQDAQSRQREIARATALKIDAIEAAMTLDIFNAPEPAWSLPVRPSAPAVSPDHAPVTLALHDPYPTELLGEEDLPDVAIAAQTAPVVEEVSILYANEQIELAAEMLGASLGEAGADRTVWWMLFDLYQISGQQEQFDNLSIDYASKFETSPPAWTGPERSPSGAAPYSGVAPTLAFSGTLDAAIASQLARMQQLAPGNPVLRLEFNRVTAIAPAGCALLLAALQTLRADKHELIVVGAAELAAQIRATLRVGRRGDSEACWLLLLELLQLLNREKEFEETGMDYCVTFEVSPPSFVPPTKVATTARQYASVSSDRFMLPAVIDGDGAALFPAIDAYAEQYHPVVFDCSRLVRIEFGTAGLLLTKLRALAAAGKKIELRDVNHLVAALLRLLAFSDIAKIFPHKY